MTALGAMALTLLIATSCALLGISECVNVVKFTDSAAGGITFAYTSEVPKDISAVTFYFNINSNFDSCSPDTDYKGYGTLAPDGYWKYNAYYLLSTAETCVYACAMYVVKGFTYFVPTSHTLLCDSRTCNVFADTLDAAKSSDISLGIGIFYENAQFTKTLSPWLDVAEFISIELEVDTTPGKTIYMVLKYASKSIPLLFLSYLQIVVTADVNSTNVTTCPNSLCAITPQYTFPVYGSTSQTFKIYNRYNAHVFAIAGGIFTINCDPSTIFSVISIAGDGIVKQVKFPPRDYKINQQVGCICLADNPLTCLGKSMYSHSEGHFVPILNLNQVTCNDYWVLKEYGTLQHTASTYCLRFYGSLKENANLDVCNDYDVVYFENGRILASSPDYCLHVNVNCNYTKCDDSSTTFVFRSDIHPLGLESGFIPNEAFEASSYIPGSEPYLARLNSRIGHWQPLSTQGAYLTVNLPARCHLYGIDIQGSVPEYDDKVHVNSSWVTSMGLSVFDNNYLIHSEDLSLLNNDPVLKTRVLFWISFLCQRVRLDFIKWKNNISVRFEIMGWFYKANPTQPDYHVTSVNANLLFVGNNILNELVCYRWTLGDGNQTIVGSSLCSSLCKCPLIPRLKQATFEFPYTYSTFGIMKVTIEEITNWSHDNYSLEVSVNPLGCKVVSVVLDDNSTTPEMARVLGQSEVFTLTAVIITECVITSLKNIFFWNIKNAVTNQSYSSPVNIGGYYQFAPGYFKPGLYSISVTGTLDLEFIVNQTATIYVRSIPTPLKLTIVGGTTRTLGYQSNAVFDAATESSDPDDPSAGSAGISFNWTCQVTAAAPAVAAACDGGVAGSAATAAGGVFTVARQLLTVGSNVTVTATAKKGDRTANYTQIGTVASGTVLLITIRCISNCDEFLSSQDDWALKVECLDCASLDGVSLAWSMFKDGVLVPSFSSLTKSGITSDGLVVMNGVLQPGSAYIVVVKASDPNNSPSEARLTGRAKLPPYNGTCASNNNTGISGVTWFQFECNYWLDDEGRGIRNESVDKGIVFTYIYSALVGDLIYTLKTTKLAVPPPFLLPAGDPTNGDLLKMTVSICNDWECTPFSFDLHVRKPAASELQNSLSSFISPNGMMSYLIQSSDTNQAVLMIQVYSSLLSGITDRNTTAAVTSSLLMGLTNSSTQLYKPGDVQQYIETLDTVVSDHSIITEDLQAAAIQSMGAASKALAACGQEKSPQVMKAAQALTSVASNILESMALTFATASTNDTKANEARVAQARYGFYGIYSNMMTYSSVVNSKEVPAGKPIMAHTPTLTVLTNTLPAKTNSSLRLNTDYGQLSLGTTKPNITAKSMKALALQIMAFRKSPFIWNQTTSVSSSVIGFQTHLDNNTISLNSMRVSLINYAAPTNEQVLNFIHDPTDSSKVSFVKFQVTSLGAMVFLKVFLNENVTTPVEVYIRYGAIPHKDPVSDDFYFWIDPSLSANSSMEKINGSAHSFSMLGNVTKIGDYYLTFKYQENAPPNTRMSIHNLMCKTWSKASDKWVYGLMQPHRDSTPENIICMAEQNIYRFPPTILEPLFIGASFFVPPNSIEFNTVFTKFDLKSNGAVFATIVTVTIVYLILVVILCRCDRQDKRAWKLLPLKDNPKDSMYQYLMTVKTGMVSDGGTKDNIFFVIQFETSDTGIRELENGYCKEFAKGSVRCFVLSTPHCYGMPLQLRIWLDTSPDDDRDRSWFLNEVVLFDIQTNEQFYFVCNNWLAVDQGDGRVCRDITMSDHQTVFDSNRLFSSTMKSNYAEGHLWSSIFFRPSKNNFSRVERLSSCVSLLFLMMLVNAMWFETDKGQASTPHIGPFTYGELFVMIASALMEVPISILIVQIFRRTGNKPWKKAGGGGGGCTSQQFPHWTLYIAWTLVVLVIGTSGFFTILYSMEWGPEKANRWLVRFLTSFCISVILIQPVKVIGLSMLGAIVAKKKQQYEDQDTLVYLKDRNLPRPVTKHESNLEDDAVELPELDHITGPPPAETLVEIREAVSQEKAASSYLKEFAVYLALISVLLIIVYTRVGDHTFLMHRMLRRTFTDSSFDKVTDQKDLWKWLNSKVLPNLYPEVGQAPAKASGIAFLAALEGYRVGPLRLQQFRKAKAVKGNSCQFKDSASKCFGMDYLLNQDSNNYSKGWQDIDTNSSYIPQPQDNFWKIQDMHWNSVSVKLGELNTFIGSGYIADLGLTFMEASGNMSYLEQNSWMDARTTGLYAQFIIYNANANLFCLVEVLVESLSADVFQPSSHLKVFRLFNNRTSYIILHNVAYIFCLIISMYFLTSVIFSITKEKFKYLKNPMNVAEIMNITLMIGAVSLFYHQSTISTESLATLTNNTAVFTDLSWPASLDRLSTQFLGLLVFLATLRILPLFHYNTTMSEAVTSVVHCAHKLCSFSLVFFVLLVSYSLIFWNVLGTRVGAYRSFGRSVGSLFAALLGAPVFADLYAAGGYMAALLYFSFMFLFAVLLLNMLVVVIDEVYTRFRCGGAEVSRCKSFSVFLRKALRPITVTYNQAGSKLRHVFGQSKK
ncbi:polycystin-1-like protein 2 [Lampetra planeri]